MSNSGDVSTFLRKVPANLTEQDFCTDVWCYYLSGFYACTWQLIDQGKVSVGDIQSELGLSSESLEAALVVICIGFMYFINCFSRLHLHNFS